LLCKPNTLCTGGTLLLLVEQRLEFVESLCLWEGNIDSFLIIHVEVDSDGDVVVVAAAAGVVAVDDDDDDGGGGTFTSDVCDEVEGGNEATHVEVGLGYMATPSLFAARLINDFFTSYFKPNLDGGTRAKGE
jgi:hypothetical protein